MNIERTPESLNLVLCPTRGVLGLESMVQFGFRVLNVVTQSVLTGTQLI